jgi:hypothetical protein
MVRPTPTAATCTGITPFCPIGARNCGPSTPVSMEIVRFQRVVGGAHEFSRQRCSIHPAVRYTFSGKCRCAHICVLALVFEYTCRQFYPELGPYSSRNATVIAQHFRVRTFCFPSFSLVSTAFPSQDMADRCRPPGARDMCANMQMFPVAAVAA